MAPTVILDASEDSPLMQEEIFGPVICIVPFETQSVGSFRCVEVALQEAIRMANNVKYGLSATVWSNDLKEVHSTAESLQVSDRKRNGLQAFRRALSGATVGWFES